MEIHRRDAVRILDFPPAAEPLSMVLEALSRGGRVFPARTLDRCLPLRKQRGPAALARLADRLTAGEINREEVRAHLSSLRKRLALLRYPLFRQAGWPSGSGMVERANKLVVEARLKGSGRRWNRSNVNPLLALRKGVCNERWQETWHVAGHQCRKARSHHRHERAGQRHLARRAPLKPDPISPPSSPRPPVPLVSPEPPTMLPGTSRPSPHHPWKRGRSCAPNQFAKK